MSAEDEFAVFVRANTSALLRTAYLLTSSANTAEELVQDTLVRLYPKWQLVASADAPMAYVRRSLANNYVNQGRRAWRREIVVETVPDVATSRDATDQLGDRDEVWTMLRELGERQRTALVLRYFDDLPDEQIAAVLGCRVGTVRSLISRGLATLRTFARDADTGPIGPIGRTTTA